jgi:hypothetical protein
MVPAIDMKDVVKRIDLPDGRRVLLLDRLAKETLYGRLECARNIYLTDQNGNIVWQVETAFDAGSGPFTNVFTDGAELKAYRWDGGTYVIDAKNGHASPSSLER